MSANPTRSSMWLLCEHLVAHGILTGIHAQDCARNRLNPKPGESTWCTCHLQEIQTMVRAELGLQEPNGGSDE